MIKGTLLYNRGINDYDGQICRKGKIIHFYKIWASMLQRCYDKKHLLLRPSYKGCSVCQEWWSLSNFKKWYDEHYIKDYQLDKDLLVRGNKIYSPQTCCFVPREVNMFLTNKQINKGVLPVGVCRDKCRNKYVSNIMINGKNKNLGRYNTIEEARNIYIAIKEAHAKVLAERYKDKIDIRAYYALMNYKEI